ncbi:MAG: DUF975 family protein [Sarcina sp.]
MRIEIKNLAKSQLKGRWGGAILAFFIVLAVTMGANFAVEFLPFPLYTIGTIAVTVFLGGAFSLGTCKYVLNFIDGRDEVTDIFSGFKFILKAAGILALQSLIIGIPSIIAGILFLLVLIEILGGFMIVIALALMIPVIIIGIMFSQSFFILADDDSKNIIECIMESKKLMKGRMLEYFLLNLSFIGWVVIAVFTCGIGTLFLAPYANITYGNYYRKITANEMNKDFM